MNKIKTKLWWLPIIICIFLSCEEDPEIKRLNPDGSCTVSFKVTDFQGSPIKGALVKMQTSSFLYKGYTDEQGMFVSDNFFDEEINCLIYYNVGGVIYYAKRDPILQSGASYQEIINIYENTGGLKVTLIDATNKKQTMDCFEVSLTGWFPRLKNLDIGELSEVCLVSKVDKQNKAFFPNIPETSYQLEVYDKETKKKYVTVMYSMVCFTGEIMNLNIYIK